jgi:hypothetical protein
VDVGVDKARADVTPPDVDLLLSVVPRANANDSVLSYDNVGLDNLTGEDVDDQAVTQREVGRFIATSDRKKLG